MASEKVQIWKRDNDSLAIRVSMGWSHIDLGTDRGYIVYRGDLKKVQEAFQKLYEAIMELKEEAEIDPRELDNN